MSYLVAWMIVISAGLIGCVALMFLTRSMTTLWLRNLICGLPLVLLLVPAPVPAYSGQFAPAFIVVIFEGLFQTNGQPLAALTIVIAALVLSSALIILASRRKISRIDGERKHN